MPADITIATTKFPQAFVNVAYEAGVATTGNASAISSTTVATGALPPGLAVDATSKLKIVGTPTTAGKFTFTLACTDGAGTVNSGSMSIVVSNPGKSPLADGNLPLIDQLKVQWPAQF